MLCDPLGDTVMQTVGLVAPRIGAIVLDLLDFIFVVAFLPEDAEGLRLHSAGLPWWSMEEQCAFIRWLCALRPNTDSNLKPKGVYKQGQTRQQCLKRD